MHCRACGAKTEALPGVHHRRCTACKAMDWVNPAPAVGLAVLEGGKVLLSRRAGQPKQGFWDLIGGFMEAGETPDEALHREVKEETGCALEGLDVRAVAPGTYDGRPTLNFLATGRLVGTPKAMDDSLELAWHPLAKLPTMAWPHEVLFLERLQKA
jgi:ADP-ribose pyrophosphatase YjhB (NUDIX family)